MQSNQSALCSLVSRQVKSLSSINSKLFFAIAGCVSEDGTLAEAILMGTDAASGWVLDEPKDGKPTLEASPLESIIPAASGFVSMLVLDMGSPILLSKQSISKAKSLFLHKIIHLSAKPSSESKKFFLKWNNLRFRNVKFLLWRIFLNLTAHTSNFLTLLFGKVFPSAAPQTGIFRYCYICISVKRHFQHTCIP